MLPVKCNIVKHEIDASISDSHDYYFLGLSHNVLILIFIKTKLIIR